LAEKRLGNKKGVPGGSPEAGARKGPSKKGLSQKKRKKKFWGHPSAKGQSPKKGVLIRGIESQEALEREPRKLRRGWVGWGLVQLPDRKFGGRTGGGLRKRVIGVAPKKAGRKVGKKGHFQDKANSEGKQNRALGGEGF